MNFYDVFLLLATECEAGAIFLSKFAVRYVDARKGVLACRTMRVGDVVGDYFESSVYSDML